MTDGITADDVLDEIADIRDRARQPVDDAARADFRDLPTYAIDPVNAQDRDDAISVLPEEYRDGQHHVYVHIADVQHYLAEDGVIDRLSRQRGRTTYYAGGADHMLPGEVASLLSFSEGDEARANTVELVYDEEGDRVSYDIQPSVVEPDRVLSYEQANTLSGAYRSAGSGDPELEERLAELDLDAQRDIDRLFWETFGPGATDTPRYRDLEAWERDAADDLEYLDEVASMLAQQRRPRDGRRTGHRVVEEFMIEANRVCARELAGQGEGIFRVHGDPQDGWDDRLQDYLAARDADEQVIETVSYDADAPMDTMRWVERNADADLTLTIDHHDDNGWAFYASFPRGHEALGFEEYAPFTAPIRRRPDIDNWRAVLSDDVDPDTLDDRIQELNGRQSSHTYFGDEAAEHRSTTGP